MFRFPVDTGDPRHPVRTSSLAANITRHIAVGHPAIVYLAGLPRAPKILIAYGKAVLVQSEGLRNGLAAERSTV
jgi:hypothetical protein